MHRFICVIALAVVGCLAWAPCSLAQAPPAVAELVVRVEAEMIGSGRLQLTLAFGSSVKDGVLLTSEPSHTPMAVVISPEFAASANGQTVREQVLAGNGAIIVTELPAGQPRLVVASRPAADQRVVVSVLDGSSQKIVSDARVGVGKFGFSTLVQGERTLHCCQNPPCPYRWVECSGPAFTCCGPPKCEIVCRHINCDT